MAKYPNLEQQNRALAEFRKMIRISKDRLSPVVTLEVASFEPIFVAELSSRLIEKSGQIQRQLKTNRVKQKRLFIEERLTEVSSELKKMEKELREFREFNRNLSGSPSLEMKVQEMGRDIDLQNSLYVTLKTQHEKAKIDETPFDLEGAEAFDDSTDIKTETTKKVEDHQLLALSTFGKVSLRTVRAAS